MIKKIRKQICRPLRRIVYYQRVFIFRWNTNQSKICLKAPEYIQISPAGIEDIYNLHSNPDFDLKDYPWPLLRKKLAKGLWYCLLAKTENRVVGYAFYTRHEMVFMGSRIVSLTLPQQSAYLFRTFVHPEARCKGIGKILVGTRLRLSCQEGLIEAYAAVNSTNKVSINNCKTLGGKIIGSVFFVKTRFFDQALCSAGLLLSGLRINT